MILNCAIVDDEPLALELLRSYVEKTSFLRLVGRYSSAVQAMTEIPVSYTHLDVYKRQVPVIIAGANK